MDGMTRVKVEFDGQEAAKYGYTANGKAVRIGTKIYPGKSMTEAGGTVVTADKEMAEALVRSGFRVRVSAPSKTYRKKNLANVAVALNAKEAAALDKYCSLYRTTRYSAVKKAVRRMINLE